MAALNVVQAFHLSESRTDARHFIVVSYDRHLLLTSIYVKLTNSKFDIWFIHYIYLTIMTSKIITIWSCALYYK
jgi:hypothetical protein